MFFRGQGMKPHVMGWRTGVQSPARAGKGFLSLLHHIQASCGAHLASYSMSAGGPFPGCKRVKA